MKSIVTIFLAVFFGAGCYTQVKSSGDYWGYTGHHEREKVVVVPDTQTQQTYTEQPYQDTLRYTEELRSRDDDGYSSGQTIINNYYYDQPYEPYGGYYHAPAVSFSVGYNWGWHRPWWSVGYSSWYPYWYPAYYDPYWDWYYSPGFSPYGCVADPYYSYPYYRHSYYGYGYGYGGYDNHGYYGNGTRHGIDGHSGHVRLGRISGGDDRGRGSTNTGRGAGNNIEPLNSGRGSAIPVQQSGTTTLGRQQSTGRTQIENGGRVVRPSTETQQSGQAQTGRTVQTRVNENVYSAPENTRTTSSGRSAEPVRTTGRSAEPVQSAPARQAEPTQQSAPARQAEPVQQSAPARQAEPAQQAAPRQSEPAQQSAPAKSNDTQQKNNGRGGGRMNMNAPRNNPRLLPQGGRVAQGNSMGRNSQSMRSSPRQNAYASAPSTRGEGYRSSGGGGNYRSNNSSVSHAATRGSSHSGNGRSR
jgi:hypothetical protein